MKSAHFNDPVAAYDLLAAHYAGISQRREAYLLSVEREIAARIPARSSSILDVGAGDGIRTVRIASQAGIMRIVLVEPSAGMSAKSGDCAEVWPVRAEDLVQHCKENVGTFESSWPHISERFDVITCLWNVLGHVAAEKRGCTLRAVAQLLNQNGRFFIDVNHRYNSRAYGIVPTCARWVRDHLFPRESNGDVLANWNVGESSISTYGHVFTHREIVRLATAAGLELEERIIINYEDGRIQRFTSQGNLLYVFRRSSRIDSSSATQTS